MFKLFGVLSLVLLPMQWVSAADLGFRFVDGICLDDKGDEGLNPSFFGQCADFRGATIGSLNLEGIDFSGSDFTSANIQLVDFSSATLMGVKFDDARILGVDLTEASIKNSSFVGTILKKTIFGETIFENNELVGADLSGSVLSFAVFQNSKFLRVNMDQVLLDDAVFQGCDLSDVSFKESDLQNTRFEYTTLLTIDFTSALLGDSNFENLDLTTMTFTKANLSQANMKRADLSGADLSYAVLDGVDFSGSKAADASFRGSSLVRAQFERADLTRSNLTGIKGDKASFASANLTSCILKFADISGSNVAGSIFEGCEFNKKTQLPFSFDIGMEKGMVLINTTRVLVLWDEKTQELEDLTKALEEDDIEFAFFSEREDAFDGQVDLAEFDSVVLYNARTYGNSMSQKGQTALLEFVKSGGTFVYHEWLTYEMFQTTGMQMFKEYALLDYQTTNTANSETLVKDAEHADHPVLKGFEEMTLATMYWTLGEQIIHSSNPSKVLLRDSFNNPMLMTRQVGEGDFIGFSFVANYGNEMLDPSDRILLSNALKFN